MDTAGLSAEDDAESLAQVYAGNEVGNAVAINGDLILPSYATVVQCVVGEATTEVKAANAKWTCKTLNVPDRDIVDDSFDMIFPAAGRRHSSKPRRRQWGS